MSRVIGGVRRVAWFVEFKMGGVEVGDGLLGDAEVTAEDGLNDLVAHYKRYRCVHPW